MYGDIRMTIRANARSRPWISSTVIGPAPRPRSRRRPSTTRSRPIPREALTSTTSPSRRRGRQHVEGGLGVADANDAVRIHARPRRHPRRSAPASGPTTTSQSTVRAAASPTTRWPSSLASPSSSISPRTAPRRPGSPASRSSAATTDRARRCSCRRRSSRHRDGRAGPGAAPTSRAARPVGDLVDGQPGGPPDRGPGQRVVDRQPAEGRDRDRSAARIGAQREAHPGEPGGLDGLGADVGVGREPVADAPGRRAACPSDGRSGRRR